jgi:pimeloyl-ACP methyl ester carboxylesterase
VAPHSPAVPDSKAAPDSGFESESVLSADGTVYGYRRTGRGPALIALHGGMQSGRSFSRLATLLSDQFTVYLPDRRGRGLSGPGVSPYGMDREVEDLAALMAETGSTRIFGLSSGALITLYAAVVAPTLAKVALYEPPVSLAHSVPMGWLERFDREIAAGDLAAALVTALQGTETDPRDIRAMPRDRLEVFIGEGLRGDGPEAVALREIVPTMHQDAQLVMEAADNMEPFASLTAHVLLLGGDRSPDYLRGSLDDLEKVVPRCRRIELPGCDHIAAADGGRPELVAPELRRFFA